jgi:mono/diheme cytochrome c family protein
MAMFRRFSTFNRRSRKLIGVVWIVLCLGLISGCAQNMYHQPRYDPLEESEFFQDRQSARHLVEGTVARGQLRDDEHLFQGSIGGQQDEGNQGDENQGDENQGGGNQGGGNQGGGNQVDTFPFPITTEVLERGQRRYNAFCMPCHGLTGNGDGMIVERGFSPPPSLHIDRLRDAPVGHYFNVITNGFGRMYAYDYQFSPADRWAIIAYIRALQLSQNATLEDLGPEDRQELQETQQ